MLISSNFLKTIFYCTSDNVPMQAEAFFVVFILLLPSNGMNIEHAPFYCRNSSMVSLQRVIAPDSSFN